MNTHQLSDIHLYCNRWCSSCPLSSACGFFADTKHDQLATPHWQLPLDDVEQLLTSYLPQLTEELNALEVIAKRFGNKQIGRQLRATIQPPSSFPLTERATLLSKRSRLAIEEVLDELYTMLTRWQATYDELGQLTLDPRPLLVAREGLKLLVWYRGIIPLRLKRTMEQLWLARRERDPVKKSERMHVALGLAMSISSALTAMSEASRALIEAIEAVEPILQLVVDEVQTLQKTLLVLFPSIRKLQHTPYWWMSWAKESEQSVVPTRAFDSP